MRCRPAAIDCGAARDGTITVSRGNAAFHERGRIGAPSRVVPSTPIGRSSERWEKPMRSGRADLDANWRNEKIARRIFSLQLP